MRKIFPLLILRHQSGMDTLSYLPLNPLHMVGMSPLGKGAAHIPTNHRKFKVSQVVQ